MGRASYYPWIVYWICNWPIQGWGKVGERRITQGCGHSIRGRRPLALGDMKGQGWSSQGRATGLEKRSSCLPTSLWSNEPGARIPWRGLTLAASWLLTSITPLSCTPQVGCPTRVTLRFAQGQVSVFLNNSMCPRCFWVPPHTQQWWVPRHPDIITMHRKVNFMCHLGWAMGCPGISFNVILIVSVSIILDEIHIWIGGLNEADCPPQCGGPHPISWWSA